MSLGIFEAASFYLGLRKINADINKAVLLLDADVEVLMTGPLAFPLYAIAAAIVYTGNRISDAIRKHSDNASSTAAINSHPESSTTQDDTHKPSKSVNSKMDKQIINSTKQDNTRKSAHPITKKWAI